jgi:hypothetical protein
VRPRPIWFSAPSSPGFPRAFWISVFCLYRFPAPYCSPSLSPCRSPSRPSAISFDDFGQGNIIPSLSCQLPKFFQPFGAALTQHHLCTLNELPKLPLIHSLKVFDALTHCLPPFLGSGIDNRILPSSASNTLPHPSRSNQHSTFADFASIRSRFGGNPNLCVDNRRKYLHTILDLCLFWSILS